MEQYNLIKRKDYSKNLRELELDGLLDIQIKSFSSFINKDKNGNSGLDDVFHDIFPIPGSDNKEKTNGYVLNYLGYDFEDNEEDLFVIRSQERNYTKKLKVHFDLKKPSGEVIRDTIFFGNIPVMTQAGTFIINGADRIVVSQLVRSPGPYFFRGVSKKTKKHECHAELIPSRGAWMKFEKEGEKRDDHENKITVKIDKSKKFPATIFLKALGFSELMLLDLYADHPALINTLRGEEDINNEKKALEVIFKRLKPGEISTEEGTANALKQRLFERKRYELSATGRYKIQQKISLYNRLLNRVLADDLLDASGKVFFERGTLLDLNKINELKEARVFDVESNGSEFDIENYHGYEVPVYIKREQEKVKMTLNSGRQYKYLGLFLEEDMRDKSGNILTFTNSEGEILSCTKGSKFTKDHQYYFSTNYIELEKNYYELKKEQIKEQKNFTVRFECDYEGLLGFELASDIFDSDGVLLLEKKKIGIIDEEALELIKDALKLPVAPVPHLIRLLNNTSFDTHHYVHKIAVYSNNDELNEQDTSVLLMPLTKTTANRLTIPDLVSVFSYFLNIIDGFYQTDDIDHLGNRRVRTCGETMQNQFKTALTKIEKKIIETFTTYKAEEGVDLDIKNLVNIQALTTQLNGFFGTSQLSQFMDQTNPLSALTNKRRLSAVGPGGLNRDRAGVDVRDVHHSHYGRICPIETPEGQNIGLMNTMASFTRINEYGFLETPYIKVKDGIIQSINVNGEVKNDIEYLSADKESDYIIASASTNSNEDGVITDNRIRARFGGENIIASPNEIQYIDVSPKQTISISTSCIPFLQNDDAQRALMGSNMQRQAIPLIKPAAPFVGTGSERIAARDSGEALISDVAGEVIFVDARKIIIKTAEGFTKEYKLQKFARSNKSTCISHTPLVNVGDIVEKGYFLADGPAMEKGDLALGQNVIVAFSTWHGYNYEDAIIMSERLVKEDVYTSLHIETYDCECKKRGDKSKDVDQITNDIPNVSVKDRRHLDKDGIVIIGTSVKEGDILVGRVSPTGELEKAHEEKLLESIFNTSKTTPVKDTSLRVNHGEEGIVIDVQRITDHSVLKNGVVEKVRVTILQKRKITEGDKMAGRHGNKGVISKILPVEDMPFLEDGTPVDLILSPLGVPSRMNLGQILEMHLGYVAKKNNLHIANPVFAGVDTEQQLIDLLKESGLSPDGKATLYDGRTGEQFDEKISIGCVYMLKLDHMVNDKLHARNVAQYTPVTQQPLGGRAHHGGQRFGEMEVWALQAYGAAFTLREMMTYKSDDILGRSLVYRNITKGINLPEPNLPEAFKVMRNELRGLGLNLRLYEDYLDINRRTAEREVDVELMTKDQYIEARKLQTKGSIEVISDSTSSLDLKLYDVIDGGNENE